MAKGHKECVVEIEAEQDTEFKRMVQEIVGTLSEDRLEHYAVRYNKVLRTFQDAPVDERCNVHGQFREVLISALCSHL